MSFIISFCVMDTSLIDRMVAPPTIIKIKSVKNILSIVGIWVHLNLKTLHDIYV